MRAWQEEGGKERVRRSGRSKGKGRRRLHFQGVVVWHTACCADTPNITQNTRTAQNTRFLSNFFFVFFSCISRFSCITFLLAIVCEISHHSTWNNNNIACCFVLYFCGICTLIFGNSILEIKWIMRTSWSLRPWCGLALSLSDCLLLNLEQI